MWNLTLLFSRKNFFLKTFPKPFTNRKKCDIRINTKQSKGGAVMNAQEIVAKADRGEGLTEEEVKV